MAVVGGAVVGRVEEVVVVIFVDSTKSHTKRYGWIQVQTQLSSLFLIISSNNFLLILLLTDDGIRRGNHIIATARTHLPHNQHFLHPARRLGISHER